MLANREALVELWCERVHGDLSDGRLRALVCGEGCSAFFAPTLNYKLPLTLVQLTCSAVDPAQPFLNLRGVLR
jgi:hypothetical protein